MIRWTLTSLVNVYRVKLIPRSYSDSQSWRNADDNGTVAGKDKVTDFFRKTERTIAVEQKQDEQLTDGHVTGEQSDAIPDSVKDNVEIKDTQPSQKAIHNFVPYTMGHLLQEMNIRKLPPRRHPDDSQSFTTLFRNSPFVQLGDLNGREVIGVVIENVNDTDLYIDFGGKFHCVCQQPQNQHYPRGSLVRIRLRDPEMTNRFMINSKAITLCEADAILIGPYRGRLLQTGLGGSESDVYFSRVVVKRDSSEAEQSPSDRPTTESDCVHLDNWRLF